MVRRAGLHNTQREEGTVCIADRAPLLKNMPSPHCAIHAKCEIRHVPHLAVYHIVMYTKTGKMGQYETGQIRPSCLFHTHSTIEQPIPISGV